ncbi:MAG TPA: zinc ABC transporter substrate-binding protein, partial [Phycisphaerales bacterium]|nr:zinc ABC transporter substrate-binding protein [Phycisphaerales bacterium]
MARIGYGVILLATAAGFLLSGGGCGREPAGGGPAPGRAERRPRVVCTVAMITDIASQIAGEDAEVTGLLGAGIDPHLYKPTRTDVETLLSADLILANGLHLEGKMAEVFERAAGAGRRVVAVAETLEESALLTPDDGAGQHDPHVWMDPTAWAGVAGAVRDALAELAPEHEAAFGARAAECIRRIEELHAYAGRVLGSVPAERRVLVTAHAGLALGGDPL